MYQIEVKVLRKQDTVVHGFTNVFRMEALLSFCLTSRYDLICKKL